MPKTKPKDKTKIYIVPNYPNATFQMSDGVVIRTDEKGKQV